MKRLLIICSVILGLVTTFSISHLMSGASAASNLGISQWLDEFDDPDLDTRWSWIREVPENWSLADRQGFMRIVPMERWPIKNLLLQEISLPNFEIETRLFFTPTENVQLAGLIVYENDQNFVSLARGYCEAQTANCSGDLIWFQYFFDGVVSSTIATTSTLGQETYLKILREGGVYTAASSLDGTSWSLIGSINLSGVNPDRYGIYSRIPTGTGASQIPADFDYFKIVDLSSNEFYLPFISRQN